MSCPFVVAVGLFSFIPSVAGPPAPQAVPASCVHYLDGRPWTMPGEAGEAGLRGSPLGTTYDVTHGVGAQSPVPQCFLVFDPGLPGAPDDVVTFDGVPEQTRTDIRGTVPTVVENFSVVGPQIHLNIQSSAPPGRQLFPGNLIGPQGQPLTDACYFLGLTDPLLFDGQLEVVQANITFLRDGLTVAGPFDVTGPPFFVSPWDGRFAMRLGGAAGLPLNINGVVLFLVCEPAPPECFTAADCDDGDNCTVDDCVNNVCIHTPLKDTLSREEALRASHGPNKDCFDSGSPPIPFPGDFLPGGARDDRWQTYPHCDGTTQFRVGMTFGDPPIPADFFNPGSEPFTGVILLKGVPLGLPGMDEVDTIVRRFDDPFERSSLPGLPAVDIPIELVSLSLASCSPITVTYPGGVTELWDVSAGLSACPPPVGSLTATKTHCNGGTFTSTLNVQPLLTFTKVGDPTQVRVLDTGCTVPPTPYDTLIPPTPIAWVHDISPNLLVVDNYASAFHAGLPLGMSTTCGDYDTDNDCDVDDFKAVLKTYGHVAGEAEYNPWIDYDVNGVVDYSDYQQWLACRRCFVGDPTAKPPPPGVLGDMDGDGRWRSTDLQGIVNCLLGLPTLGCLQRADIDQNGVLDHRDIPGMVLLVLELS
jgi:hypothetical protein